MGFADLTEDEQKFFDSKGKEGAPDEPVDIGQNEPALSTQAEPEPEPEQPESGGGLDAADDGETAPDSSASDVAESDNRSESERTGKKRDFEKAYSAAESKRIELKRQLREQQEQTQALKQQFDQLASHVRTAAQPEVQVPDKDEDPMGYYAHQFENLERTVKQQQEHQRRIEEEQKRAQQMNQFVSAYQQQAAEFAQEQADFSDAYRFLENSRITEYTAAGYTPQEASRMLQEDEVALASRAWQDGVNPAERLYQMAVARGYSPNAVPEPAPQASKLESVEKGLKNAKSLSNAKSKSVTAKLDASMIDQMSDDEFDKYFSQMKNQAKKDRNYMNY